MRSISYLILCSRLNECAKQVIEPYCNLHPESINDSVHISASNSFELKIKLKPSESIVATCDNIRYSKVFMI